MAEIKFQVPEFLSGFSHLPTTLSGLALLAAPFILDAFYPGAGTAATKIISIIGGTGLVLSTGDTKPPPPDDGLPKG